MKMDVDGGYAKSGSFDRGWMNEWMNDFTRAYETARERESIETFGALSASEYLRTYLARCCWSLIDSKQEYFFEDNQSHFPSGKCFDLLPSPVLPSGTLPIDDSSSSSH